MGWIAHVHRLMGTSYASLFPFLFLFSCDHLPISILKPRVFFKNFLATLSTGSRSCQKFLSISLHLLFDSFIAVLHVEFLLLGYSPLIFLIGLTDLIAHVDFHIKAINIHVISRRTQVTEILQSHLLFCLPAMRPSLSKSISDPSAFCLPCLLLHPARAFICCYSRHEYSTFARCDLARRGTTKRRLACRP